VWDAAACAASCPRRALVCAVVRYRPRARHGERRREDERGGVLRSMEGTLPLSFMEVVLPNRAGGSAGAAAGAHQRSCADRVSQILAAPGGGAELRVSVANKPSREM
jgi:hypothetical protein